MRKEGRTVEGLISGKGTSSHTLWKWEGKTVGQKHAQSQINKFTYKLQMIKENGTMRCMVSVKARTSHTGWKWESKTKWSDGWSESNEQVHIPPVNEKARQNGQKHSQSQINSSLTSWKWESKMKWPDAWSEWHQRVDIHPENENARWNGQMECQSQINNFSYRLKIRK